jgi:geranylgeranyl diphosphate synthase type I
MELLHTFMLIHDDVIDRSDTRRGHATLRHSLREVFAGHARKEALADDLCIVLGDICFALAVEEINSLPIEPELRGHVVQRVMASAAETGFGQLLDVLHGTSELGAVDLTSIVSCYELKTARYSVELPLVLGALLAGAPSSTHDPLSALATSLGVAYQLNDDLVGVRQASDEKSPSSDFEEGRQTALLLMARQGAATPDRGWLSDHFGCGVLAADGVPTLMRIYRDSGAIAAVEGLIQARALDARRQLAALEVRSGPLAALLEQLVPTSFVG